MATKPELKAISELQKDVSELKTNQALTQRDVQYIKDGQDDLKQAVQKIVYPSMELFNKLETRVTNLEIENKNNTLGTVFANLLANKAFTLVAGAIIAAALYYVVTKGTGIK